jgi:hypothetical protein
MYIKFARIEIDSDQVSLIAVSADALARGHLVRFSADWSRAAPARNDEIRIQYGASYIDLLRWSQAESGFAMDLRDVEDTFCFLAELAKSARAYLVWSASGVVVDGAAAGTLIARWIESREPPTLSIVGLSLESAVDGLYVHKTVGLLPFAGQELAIKFGTKSQSMYAAKMLARIARHVLMWGPVRPEQRVISVDQVSLVVKREDDPVTGSDIVTILL